MPLDLSDEELRFLELTVQHAVDSQKETRWHTVEDKSLDMSTMLKADSYATDVAALSTELLGRIQEEMNDRGIG
jgi:hypothetical protein